MVPGLIGTMAALECLKLVSGKPKENLLWKRMLIMDSLSMRFRTVKIRDRNPACAVCGEKPELASVKEVDYNSWCKRMCDIYASIELNPSVSSLSPQ